VLLAAGTFEGLMKKAELNPPDVAYIASTGDAEELSLATGHFFSMTSHSKGAVHLVPRVRAVLDVGGLNVKAIRIDGRGKVLSYRMAARCASGSGRFLENISRYLGIMVDEVGELSLQADKPEIVSTVCAVLAETDVINLVSREISTSNILKGIHLAMSQKLIKLLRASKISRGDVLLTGGLAKDQGLVAALNESLSGKEKGLRVITHEDSVYAGAIGAALWGAFRYEKLLGDGRLAEAS
jgi:benzoyl-CoA reductase subunit D